MIINIDMEGLIGSFAAEKRFRVTIFSILAFQGLISVLLSILCYLLPSFSMIFEANDWLLFLALGMYIVSVISFALINTLKVEPNNCILIIIVALSTNILDTCAAKSNPSTVLQVLSFLFSGVLGLLAYYLLSNKELNNIYAILASIISNTLMFLLLLLSGFNSWINLSIFFCVSILYSAFLLLLLSDLNKRYKSNLNEPYNGVLYIYLDILIIPYLFSKSKLLLK